MERKMRRVRQLLSEEEASRILRGSMTGKEAIELVRARKETQL